jgi:N-acetylneuraminic acid mutarotase
LKDVKNGPSGRSGHRMIRWKNKMIVFGGFYDTITETKYFNDFHMLDLDTLKWTKVEFKEGIDVVPKPRSAFQIGLYENTLFIYGGYSKEKIKTYGEAKGVVHTDMWSMNLAAPKLAWEKAKKGGIAPSPRSGMTTVVDKKRMIVFGGVIDEEDEDDNMKSIFYNDLYYQNE